MGLGDVAEDVLEDTITGLRSVLADLQGLDLWPPWDAAATLVDLVGRACSIAGTPPEPSPVDIRDAADEWRLIAAAVGRGHADLETAGTKATPAVWEGSAGNAFRRSITTFAAKVDTVSEAALGVAAALDTNAASMDAARARHADAFDELRGHLSISWGDLLPWQLADKVARIAGAVVDGVRDLIGAYQDASAAISVARRAVTTAMDGIELPDHLPTHVPSVIDIVNLWDDDRGPLEGSVLRRYDDAVTAMTDEQRAQLDLLLAGTDDPLSRAWIMAAVAAGLTGTALTRYAAQLDRLPDPSQLDPGAFRDGQRTQPDETTCGSSSLVMSRMENDPAFAMWILNGYDPLTGETDAAGSAEDRFDQAVLDMHERTNALHDRGGGFQLPWPSALGTQPWALAAEMSADGGSGVPGTNYDVSAVDPGDPGRSFDAAVRASEEGHTVPFYVGDGTHPGHVALITGSSGDTLTVYEPFHGETITVDRDDWVNGTFDIAGWSQPWLVVVPQS